MVQVCSLYLHCPMSDAEQWPRVEGPQHLGTAGPSESSAFGLKKRFEAFSRLVLLLNCSKNGSSTMSNMGARFPKVDESLEARVQKTPIWLNH